MKKRLKRESKELPGKNKYHYQIYISIKGNIHRALKNVTLLVQTSPNNNTNMLQGYKLLVSCAYKSVVFCHLYLYTCGIARGIAVWPHNIIHWLFGRACINLGNVVYIRYGNKMYKFLYCSVDIYGFYAVYRGQLQ